MAADTTEGLRIPIDPGNAPDIFIDGYTGVSVKDGVVRLNLVTTRLNANMESATDVIVSRLAMPLAVMLRVHEALGHLIRDLERDKVIVRKTEGGD